MATTETVAEPGRVETALSDVPKSQDGAPDKSAKDNVTAKRALTAVNFFVETNRLEPYTAVYLIDGRGWNEVNFGVVSLVMNTAMLVFQTPAGDLLDKTTRAKKPITALAIFVAAVTTAMPVWTADFWAILVGKTIEGISATIFLPALMSLLLGICQTEAEVPSFIAANEVSNKVGSFLFVCACAAISYLLFPDVESMFYLLGAGGLAAALFTMAIPGPQIDHDRARQLAHSDTEDTVDEAADGGAEDERRAAPASPSRYRELFQNRTIVLFAGLTFSYHLANAGVLPLLAQFVATVTPEELSLTWTSGLLIVNFFTQTISSFLMTFVVDRFDAKRIMTIAFVILPIRCTAIALIIVYLGNPWALAATQALDGVGAGVYDTMLPIMVKKLTKGSGRFGFAFGFVVTMWRIGHGISLLVGEAMVHSLGYTAAFGALGSLGLLNLVWFVLFFDFGTDSDAEGQRGSPESDEEDGNTVVRCMRPPLTVEPP